MTTRNAIFICLVLTACKDDEARKETEKLRTELEATKREVEELRGDRKPPGKVRWGEDDDDRTLKVTGLEPDRGDADGGTYVVIQGKRFIADGPRRADVYFGTQAGGFRKGTVVRFASDQKLIVQAPGGTPGAVADVLVTFEPGGQLRLPHAFTFVEKR